MDRIEAAFAKARGERRIALIGYLPAGYPSLEEFPRTARAAFEAGLDILEIGLPTEDPFLDGEVIREAVIESMRCGLDARSALSLASGLAAEGRPLVAMMYGRSWEELGGDGAAKAIAEAGFSGLLVVGCDDGLGASTASAARAAGLDPIGFVAEQSGAAMSRLAAASGGFIYLPSHEGKTGDRNAFGSEVAARLSRAKAAIPGLPVAIGFGVNSPKDVAALRRMGADGAIVGTALVEAARDLDRTRAYVASLRAASHGGWSCGSIAS